MWQSYIDYTYWMTNEFKIQQFLRSVAESEVTDNDEIILNKFLMLTTDSLVWLTRSASGRVIQQIRNRHLKQKRRISAGQREVLAKWIYANVTDLKSNFIAELNSQLLNGLQRKYISRQGH